MSIASQIQRIKQNIANAYAKCNLKGITLPTTQNSDNLASTINKISAISDKEKFRIDYYKYGKERCIVDNLKITSNTTEVDISELGIDEEYIQKASNSTYLRNNFKISIKLKKDSGTLESTNNIININQTEIAFATGSSVSLNNTTKKIIIDTTNESNEVLSATISFCLPDSPLKFSDFLDDGDVKVPDYFNVDNVKLNHTEVASTANTLPASIKTIGQYAFSIFQNSIGYSSSGITTLPSNLRVIEKGAYYSNKYIFFESLPNTLEEIESYAFYSGTEDSNLKISNFGNSLKKIGDNAFRNRTGICATQLPDTLESLGSGAFFRCSSIKIEKIPYKISAINSNCFNKSGIEKIQMVKVNSIYNYSFSNCLSLQKVRIGDEYTKSETLTIDSSAFSSDNNLTTIYINLPRATVEAIAGYNTKWGATNATIICNDDENWVSANEDN